MNLLISDVGEIRLEVGVDEEVVIAMATTAFDLHQSPFRLIVAGVQAERVRRETGDQRRLMEQSVEPCDVGSDREGRLMDQLALVSIDGEHVDIAVTTACTNQIVRFVDNDGGCAVDAVQTGETLMDGTDRLSISLIQIVREQISLPVTN